MIALDLLKAGVVFLLAVLVQIAFVDRIELAEGHPNIVLVTLVCVALLRGPTFGAAGGFFAGLVLDTAAFEIVGLSSFLLVLAGYWTGKLGLVVRPGLSQIPFLATIAATVGVGVTALLVNFLLGTPVGLGRLLTASLLPELALNLLLVYPTHALLERAFPPSRVTARAVSVLG